MSAGIPLHPLHPQRPEPEPSWLDLAGGARPMSVEDTRIARAHADHEYEVAAAYEAARKKEPDLSVAEFQRRQETTR